MFPILKDSPLFAGLDQQTIDTLLEHASYTTTTFDTDTYIARRDTAYSGLMIILRGSVRGEVTDAAGHRRTIDNIVAPQLIAPAFLFGGTTACRSTWWPTKTEPRSSPCTAEDCSR